MALGIQIGARVIVATDDGADEGRVLGTADDVHGQKNAIYLVQLDTRRSVQPKPTYYREGRVIRLLGRVA